METQFSQGLEFSFHIKFRC